MSLESVAANSMCSEWPRPAGSGEPELLDLDQLARGSEQLGEMVGRSEEMRAVFTAVRRLSPYKATVLIQGESGTGKELVARALHNLGPAPRGPLVIFDCSNLIESLAESQLFGHVRGAFTDAREESLGYFRSANGGTLFLDEIGELPVRLQAKLLRAVETYEVWPVGSTRGYRVDIRIVAASNRDLRAMLKTGEFREDLYYRLNASSIFLPSLRSHLGDAAVLAAHFIERYNRILGRQVEGLSNRALRSLGQYDWPGNVREFSHAIESAVMLAAGAVIDQEHLPPYLAQTGRAGGPAAAWPGSAAPPAANGKPSPFSLDEVMRETLLRSLEETDGNRRRAAGLLGVSRSTLYRMLARYGLADGVSRAQRR